LNRRCGRHIAFVARWQSFSPFMASGKAIKPDAGTGPIDAQNPKGTYPYGRSRRAAGPTAKEKT